MVRRLFTAVVVVSLLLCASVCVVWVRSFWKLDAFTYRPITEPWYRQTMVNGASLRGKFSFHFSSFEILPPPSNEGRTRMYGSPTGFEWNSRPASTIRPQPAWPNQPILLRLLGFEYENARKEKPF